jgi:hypothetical protein
MFGSVPSALSVLSRRDERTQPGVLTPGIDKNKWSALKGRQVRILCYQVSNEIKTNYLPPLQGGFAGWIYSWG